MKTWYTLFVLLLCGSALVAQTANIAQGCAPLFVQFNGPAGQASYFWDFQDGGTATIQNPQRNFTTPGVYDVELRETVNGPVIGTVQIQVYATPTIDTLILDPPAGCVPQLMNFELFLNIDDSVQISNYTWGFGGANTINTTVNTVSNTYTQAGSFPLSIGLTTNQPGCDTVFSLGNIVSIDEAPDVSFETDTSSACDSPLTVNFLNTSDGGAGFVYVWDFGNGETSTLREPEPVTYTDLGRYTVTLTVINQNGCFNTASQIINVGPPAILINYPDTVCTFSPFTIENNNSIDNATWDFGPNGTGTLIAGSNNYRVTFDQRGEQTVSLTLTSPDGQCSSDTTFTIFVDQADATFISVPTFGCNKNLTATFTPNVNVPGATYEWTFEGGDTSTQFAPTYTYMNEDTTIHSINGPLYFETRLRVTNPSGCVAIFRLTDTIHQPNALFAVDDIKGCLPLEVTFSDSSSSLSPLTEWFWDFGDGTSETRNDDNDVMHTYTTPGEYDARLIVTNENGCMDTSYVIQILVGDQISGVDFEADRFDVCQGDTVQFTDLTNNPDIDAWHFATDQGRSFHCYQDPSLSWAFEQETGPMDVSLTVEYNGCFTTVTKSDYINVNGPIAQLDYEIDCANPFTVSFRDSSMDATNVQWEFGDTLNRSMAMDTIFTFPDTGNYVVKLFAENTNNACPISVDSATVYIRDVKADITLDTILCLGQEYQLDASGSEGVDADCWKGYTWFFPNVERPITTQDSSISHMFNRPDTQTVILVVEDINGCQDTAELDVRVFGIYPDLTADDLSICNPATVTFGNATTADTTIVSIEWEFGDPNMGTSTDSLPVYTYTEPPGGGAGGYTVNVNFEDAVGCPGSGSLTLNWYEPVSTITALPEGICVGDEIIFSASDFTQEGSFLNYNWDFGNGQTSTQQSETIAYTDPGQTGDVTVTLQFEEDATGCQGETMTTIGIHDFPIADLSAEQDTNSLLCPGFITFFDESQTNFPPLTRTWNFGDSNSETTTSDSVTTFYNEGTYQLELIVATEFGCADTTVRNLEFSGPFGDFDVFPLTLPTGPACLGETFTFVLKDTTNVTNWLWDFGEGFSSPNEDSVEFTYSFVPPTGFQTVSLQLIDANGCDVVVQDIVYLQNTFADFELDTNSYCTNEIIGITNNSPSDGVSFTWTFGNGDSRNGIQPTYSYPEAGDYTIELIAVDDIGCTDTTTQMVTINPGPTAELMDSGPACANTPYNLTITGYDPNANTYTLSPNGNISNTGVATVTPDLNNNTYQLIVTSNANGCTSTTLAELEVFSPLDDLPDTPIDTSACPGEPIDLIISFENPPPGITYAWTGSGVSNLSCTDCPNPMYTAPAGVQSSEQVIVTANPNNGCPEESATFNISAGGEEFFDMPNSFTPNGDNLNDVFNYVIKEDDRGRPVIVDRFQVFNRFGEMVYDNETPDTGWDGMQDGEPAPSDTYVYIIELTLDDCQIQRLNGNFMLIR